MTFSRRNLHSLLDRPVASDTILPVVPVAQSVFGKDPFEPVRSSEVAGIIREQSSKPVQIDEYVQERGRILSILADQAMQFLDSRAAIHLAYFLKQTTELNSDYAKASLIGCCDKAHHTETATTLFLVKIKDCLKFRTFSWT